MTCCYTCILRAKKVSFWADDASSWDLEYSLLPLKPSLDKELEDEDPCCATQLDCQILNSPALVERSRSQYFDEGT